MNPDFVRRAANLLHFGLATFLTAASTATYADNKAPTPQCLDTPRSDLQVISGKNIEVRVDELGHPSVISFIPVGLVRANRRSEFLVRGAFNSQSETVACLNGSSIPVQLIPRQSICDIYVAASVYQREKQFSSRIDCTRP